jgi:hypothetical protein
MTMTMDKLNEALMAQCSSGPGSLTFCGMGGYQAVRDRQLERRTRQLERRGSRRGVWETAIRRYYNEEVTNQESQRHQVFQSPFA